MASKRALQCIILRSSSILLRSQCSVPRRTLLRTATVRDAINRPSTVLLAQRRWHSGIPSEQKSKVYEFDDVRRIVESPTPDVVLIGTSPSLSPVPPLPLPSPPVFPLTFPDVREPSEHLKNAIPTSLNIPITSYPDALLLPPEEFEDRFGFQKPPVTKEVVFYCKAGVRSAAAAQIARQGGYEKVGEYRGSWIDWERRGGVQMKSPGGKGEPEDAAV
ncbi:Rhodanese-like protein [Zopfia rhizophila CBS 207.26]|uniref:Rhodanese-like protein n=1 Tax=Zopfia rhizophila CBS 207.26 TaxID=1314779 RepID=A0A6A6EM27_9PEZI|nr:Rhodanese-like protein [Zopfia rhizophila CBS 207.26]